MLHKLKSPRNSVLASFALLVIVSSCDKDDDPPPVNRTITEVVVATDAFSTLETAVIKAELQGTLSSAGPFTVFAPDNDAFTSSGISSSVLASLPKDEVANFLLYHTLNGKVMASGVPAGPNEKVITASGDSVFLTRNASGVYINGVAVQQADIAASNGVIHRIGSVLMPARGNLVATAQAPGSGLDSLLKAVVRASTAPGGDPLILSSLQSARLTVFAPDNAAFTQLLGALGLSDINAIPVATLAAVLKYHVVAGRVFSSDLSNGPVTMLAGGNTTVNLSGGASITGSGNTGNKSNITKANIVATNGVVHIIDRVLLP